jgi:hypothetical protein
MQQREICCLTFYEKRVRENNMAKVWPKSWRKKKRKVADYIGKKNDCCNSYTKTTLFWCFFFPGEMNHFIKGSQIHRSLMKQLCFDLKIIYMFLKTSVNLSNFLNLVLGSLFLFFIFSPFQLFFLIFLLNFIYDCIKIVLVFLILSLLIFNYLANFNCFLNISSQFYLWLY